MMLAAILILAQAVAGCPTPAQAQGAEVVELRAGCPSPLTGWLYTPQAYADNAAELAGLGALLTDARAALSDARTQRDTEAESAAHLAGERAATIRALTDEVDDLRGRHGPLVWITVGAVSALVVGAVAALAVGG